MGSPRLEAGLASGWGEARIRLTVEVAADIDRAAALLAPAQPFRGELDTVSFRVARDGSGPSTESVRRLLARLDGERLHGTLVVVSSQEALVALAAAPAATLPESWAAALANPPGRLERPARRGRARLVGLLRARGAPSRPDQPPRVGEGSVLQFRSASRFGYGASPGMVGRCFERCDAEGIRGTVRVLRVLSDTRPVGTQGPVWQIDGRTV